MPHRAAVLLSMCVSLVCVALAGGPAAAVPTTCLPFPLPPTPQPPVFTLSMDRFSEHGTLDLWRQACEDGSGEMAVLARITPATGTLFVCSINFTFSQDGATYDTLVTNAPAFNAHCNDIEAPTTFLLSQRFGQPTFRERAPFTLNHGGSPATFVEVPAPTITLVNLGCTPCGPGSTVSVRAQVTNPGPAMPSEIKAGVRFPDGSIVPIFRVDRPLGAGEVFELVLIPALVLPADIGPPGVYVVEAAILEPALGLLWSRASTRLVVP